MHRPTEDHYNLVAELMEQGVVVSKMYQTLGISERTFSKHYGFMLKGYVSKFHDRTRDCDMCNRFRSGETLEKIGQSYDLTRERIRQILSRYNLTAQDGGQHVVSLENKKKRASISRIKLDIRTQKYGVDGKTYKRIKDEIGSKKIEHFNQLRWHVVNADGKAYAKGTKWEISLEDWCDTWERAGLEAQQEGYFFTRIDRKKGFTKDNVEILGGNEFGVKCGSVKKPRKAK